MKHHTPYSFKISTIILGCFLLLNYGSVMGAPPCNPVTTDTTVAIPCGTSVMVGAQQYNSSGDYVDTLTSSLGCDSIVTLHLTVDTIPATVIVQTICNGDSFTFSGGVLYASGTYVDSLTGSHGCDSVVIVQLTVITATQSSVSATICNGDIYVFGVDTLTAAGTYTDTIFSSMGCDSVEVTLTLTVNTVDVPFITEQGTALIASGDNNVLYYQWYVDDIPDTTANGFNYYYFPAADGNYLVGVYDPNSGCSAYSDEYYFVMSDIHNINAFNLKLYPNPNSGAFTVQFTDNGMKEVSVLDMMGQVISPAKKVAQKENFDLSDLAAGVYILKVKDTQNANQVAFERIFIQR